MKNSNNRLQVLLLVRGVAMSMLILGLFAMLIAIITYATTWYYSNLFLRVIGYISVFGGAFYMAKSLNQKLWLHGALVGVIFLVVITLLRMDLNLFFHWLWLKQLVIVAIIGVSGSVIRGLWLK